MSGSAVGTITRSHFEVSADDGRRIHFKDSGSEWEYHQAEQKKIARALAPLADRIETYLSQLASSPPWIHQLKPYQAVDPSVRLAAFERADHRQMLADIQARGPYRYLTSFPHQLADGGWVHVTVRLVLSGPVALGDLHSLEDGLRALRTPMPVDPREAANPEGPKSHLQGCPKWQKKLDRIRTVFGERLEQRGLLFKGNTHEGSLFTARIQGPDLCLVSLELTLAGDHQWGRTRRALIDAVQAVFPKAREWPGFPLSQEADEAPWRIEIPPPVE